VNFRIIILYILKKLTLLFGNNKIIRIFAI
jgi:hypothetical protein